MRKDERAGEMTPSMAKAKAVLSGKLHPTEWGNHEHLNGMGNEMDRNLGSATDKEEETAIKECEEFIAAERKEIDTLTASIETKTQRIGELVVAIVQTKKRPP